MKSMPLYIIRQNSTIPSQALFCPSDPSCRVFTISPNNPVLSASEASERLLITGTESSTEQSGAVSYDTMLDMILAAPKVMVL